ncbi:hypothetical protein [Ascidiimonas aurantiaca]|uniref:hypothetical protein n=1 Tax=Ascidiimonas aurantiaca TaxID=1685432 RepID=UPI0030EE8181
MKKKQIKKLSLQKTRISVLEQRAVSGGNNFTNDCVTFQETICFTRCYGEQNCQLYQTELDCTGTSRAC